MKKFRIGLVLVIVTILVIAIGSTAVAKNLDPVSIEVVIEEADFVSMPRTGSGTFSASETIVDEGAAYTEWWPSKKHRVTLIILEGDDGDITIRAFSGYEVIDENCVAGSWTIIDGTEDYENLRGKGTLKVCGEVDEVPFTMSLSGYVH